jgi:hypothetical protein
MNIYNMHKHAQQTSPPMPVADNPLQLQQMLQQQDALIANIQARLKTLHASASSNPNAILPQIQQAMAELSSAQQGRMQVVQALWGYQKSLGAQVRTKRQDTARAILENNDQVLSQMSAEDYVTTRDNFLRSAPRPNAGESMEDYKTRVKEWVYQYNPSGDLVESFTSKIMAMRQQELRNRTNIADTAEANRSRADKNRAAQDQTFAAQQASRASTRSRR